MNPRLIRIGRMSPAPSGTAFAVATFLALAQQNAQISSRWTRWAFTPRTVHGEDLDSPGVRELFRALLVARLPNNSRHFFHSREPVEKYR